MMRLLRISFIILSFTFFLSVSPKVQAAEAVFFESLYDIPVMVGLTEVTEMGLSFDKAQGRLAYAAAVSEDIDEDDVLAFYSKALAQMGWEEVTPRLFSREHEKLEISFEEVEDSKLVKFSLKPDC